MPRTRHEVGREAKVNEIVELAERQLREGGFPALSMAAIARELHVAQNAVYWYFPSRDHLFVAVLRKLVREFEAAKPQRAQTIGERAVWIIERIAELHPLVVAMVARSRESAVVAELNNEIEGLLRSMLERLVSAHVPSGEVDIAVDALWATIEGVLLRPMAAGRRAAVVRYVLREVIGESALEAPA